MSDAFNELAEAEADAMVQLLETDTRKILVVVISAEGANGTLNHAVSSGTVGLDARVFLQAIDRQRDRIASRLIKRG